MKWIFVFLIILVSCTSIPTPDMGVPGHPDPTLQPQMQFSVDERPCFGTCTVPRKTSSKITLTPPAKTHLLLINTCARQVPFWDPAEGKRFEFNYSPAFDVENRGVCPLLITAVTLSGELHRGIVSFDNVGAYNPAKVQVMCNGEWIDSSGSYLCSVAAGLPVMVKSVTPSVIAKDPDSLCPEPRDTLRGFVIETVKPKPEQSSLCVYVLLNKNKEEFKLAINTFSSILGTFPKDKNK